MVAIQNDTKASVVPFIAAAQEQLPINFTAEMAAPIETVYGIIEDPVKEFCALEIECTKLQEEIAMIEKQLNIRKDRVRRLDEGKKFLEGLAVMLTSLLPPEHDI